MSTLLYLRFDRKICTFDICKTFLQVNLLEKDSNRLCMVWFRDVSKVDFTIVAYKANRLPFGLPCSPTLLMLSLFKMLVVDSKEDPQS